MSSENGTSKNPHSDFGHSSFGFRHYSLSQATLRSKGESALQLGPVHSTRARPPPTSLSFVMRKQFESLTASELHCPPLPPAAAGAGAAAVGPAGRGIARLSVRGLRRVAGYPRGESDVAARCGDEATRRREAG